MLSTVFLFGVFTHLHKHHKIYQLKENKECLNLLRINVPCDLLVKSKGLNLSPGSNKCAVNRSSVAIWHLSSSSSSSFLPCTQDSESICTPGHICSLADRCAWVHEVSPHPAVRRVKCPSFLFVICLSFSFPPSFLRFLWSSLSIRILFGVARWLGYKQLITQKRKKEKRKINWNGAGHPNVQDLKTVWHQAEQSTYSNYQAHWLVTDFNKIMDGKGQKRYHYDFWVTAEAKWYQQRQTASCHCCVLSKWRE